MDLSTSKNSLNQVTSENYNYRVISVHPTPNILNHPFAKSLVYPL